MTEKSIGLELSRCLSYSQDGSRILSLGCPLRHDPTVNLLCATTGEKLLEVEFEGDPHSLELASAKFGQNGHEVIVLVDDFSKEGDGIRVLNAETGEQAHHFGQGTSFCDIDVSPHGDAVLAIGSNWRSLRIWNYTTGECVYSQEMDVVGEPVARISPNGFTFFAASENNQPISISDVRTGSELISADGGYWDGVFSPDSSQLLLWSDHADLWDLELGKKVLEFGEASLAGFSPDGRFIFTASYEHNSIRIWDTRSGHELQSFENFRTQNWTSDWGRGTPGFSPDGLSAVTCEGSFARIRSIESGKALRQFECPDSVVTSAVFNPNGKYVLICSWKHTPHKGFAPHPYIWNLY